MSHRIPVLASRGRILAKPVFIAMKQSLEIFQREVRR